MMKINKSISKALLAMMAVTGFAACSSDDYEMASMPATSQVYFSNEISSEILLEDGQNSVEIEVTRVKTDGSLTVDLAVADTSAAKLFTVPSSVTFADGQATAKIPVSFTFANLAADNPYAIDLTLNGETSAYGDAQKQFIIKYAPWTEWAPLGWDYPSSIAKMESGQFAAWEKLYASMGENINISMLCDGDITTYAYSKYLSGVYAQPAFMRQSMLNPKQRQIMLYDWFYGVDLMIDWTVSEDGNDKFSIAPQKTGYFHPNYNEDVYVTDTRNYILNDGDPTNDDAAESHKCYYDKESGRFYFDVVYYISLGIFGNGYEYLQLPGYVQKDYAVNFTDNGAYQSSKLLGEIFSVELGSDISKIQYAAFAGELTEEEIEANANGIFAGDIESTTTTESGNKVVIVDEKGVYTLVIIPYDENGNRMDTQALTFNVLPPSAEKTYTPIYVGDFTYGVFFVVENDEPFYQEGMALYVCDQDETKFKIEDWGYGVDYTFTMLANGSVQVDDQETGYTDPRYGTIYVGDITSYSGSTKYGVSSYDSETGIFTFHNIYYCDAGNFGHGEETFELTGKAAAAIKRAIASAKTKAEARAKVNKKWTVKKVDVQKSSKPRVVSNNQVLRKNLFK